MSDTDRARGRANAMMAESRRAIMAAIDGKTVMYRTHVASISTLAANALHERTGDLAALRQVLDKTHGMLTPNAPDGGVGLMAEDISELRFLIRLVATTDD